MSRTQRFVEFTARVRQGPRVGHASPASAIRFELPRLLAAILLGSVLSLAAASTARADGYVAFPDPGLRAAVASQLASQGQIPAGSNGTTISPSDMETLTALSAPNSGIASLTGLQYAENLTSLDVHGNHIADLTALGGLEDLAQLDVSRNFLDLTPGTPTLALIVKLQGLGAHVVYGLQRSALSGPTVSSSACVFGRTGTFSATIVPRGAATPATSKALLYHLETKTVTKRVKGKNKRVKVNYWRLRRTLSMQPGSGGGVSVRAKLPYAGKWQVRVAYAGSADYLPCGSSTVTFVVQDPRINAAITWAMHRRGSHSWDHYCLRFVCDSYASGAHATVARYSTAKQAASALHARSQPSANAPRGAWVFYDSTPQGHVGISLGDGTMVNDYGGAGVKVMRIKDGGHYIGWAAPPLSPPITDWNVPTK